MGPSEPPQLDVARLDRGVKQLIGRRLEICERRDIACPGHATPPNFGIAGTAVRHGARLGVQRRLARPAAHNTPRVGIGPDQSIGPETLSVEVVVH